MLCFTVHINCYMSLLHYAKQQTTHVLHKLKEKYFEMLQGQEFALVSMETGFYPIQHTFIPSQPSVLTDLT